MKISTSSHNTTQGPHRGTFKISKSSHITTQGPHICMGMWKKQSLHTPQHRGAMKISQSSHNTTQGAHTRKLFFLSDMFYVKKSISSSTGIFCRKPISPVRGPCKGAAIKKHSVCLLKHVIVSSCKSTHRKMSITFCIVFLKKKILTQNAGGDY